MKTTLKTLLKRTLVAAAIGLAPLSLAQSPEGPGGGFRAARPWLGVAIDKDAKGVKVKDVLAGTPAKAAGFVAGDVITAVDGTAVTTPEQLIATVAAQGVGNTVTVHYLRAGKAATKQVKLVARPDELELLQAQLVGKPAPAFDLPVVSGDAPGKTEALKGKVAVVEFWATWCPACRSTHARLSQWAKAHRKSVNVVAISDEDQATIFAYAKQHHLAFTVLKDEAHVTPGPWMVSAIPQIVVVDKQGVVQFATVGAGEYLEEALAAAEKLAKAH